MEERHVLELSIKREACFLFVDISDARKRCRGDIYILSDVECRVGHSVVILIDCQGSGLGGGFIYLALSGFCRGMGVSDGSGIQVIIAYIMLPLKGITDFL